MGSNDITILNSLFNVFNMDETKFKDTIKKYYQINKERLDNIESSLLLRDNQICSNQDKKSCSKLLL